MCGIAGYVGEGRPETLAAMLPLLKHRGPDDEGMHVEPGVGLGMTRLAIIDVASGRQPMASEDESVRLVCNGEIYNFRELRSELERGGHRFRTRSDTEVLLRAYEAFGDGCVERLRGMFAFALWDRRRRRLLLARDRLGKKPLYYRQRDGVLFFASEIKALLRHPAVGREVDDEALHHYLAFGYTPGDRSIFAEIASLPPAHVAVATGDRMDTSRYWAPPSGKAARASAVPAAEAPGLVRRALADAVRLRLESDVPLGVFLSGGIDSSAVVASMREVTGQRIATVTVGFGAAEPSFDELPYARLVARRFDTDHHEEVLEPCLADLLPAVVQHFDEPFADSSALATFVVAQATARHVKVAQSGRGGDEAFAGYPRYLGLRLSQAYARLPAPLRSVAGAAVRTLARESGGGVDWGARAGRFVASAALPLPERYLAWTRFFGDADLARLATPALRARLGADVAARQRAAWDTRDAADPVDGAFRIDLATYLPADLLVMADRMSMAHSLEVRAPFCDHRLLELSLSVPSAVKLRGGRLKALLKAAFADVLPPELLRRPKQGFMVPLARWLRGDLREPMEDLLADDRVRSRGLFAPAAVAALKREHLEGRRSHADRLWALMVLEQWMRQYLDGAGTAATRWP
jgi:asparagine synthase (glutamine-hydrolysing)